MDSGISRRPFKGSAHVIANQRVQSTLTIDRTSDQRAARCDAEFVNTVAADKIFDSRKTAYPRRIS